MSVDKVKVRLYLVKLFSQVLTEDEVNNNRRRAFATIASYTSPSTGQTVGSILSDEEIGSVINGVRDYHMNRRIQAVAKRIQDETGGF